MPKYVMGLVTPGMSGISFPFSKSPRSFRPHPSQSGRNSDKGVSAPYVGGLMVTDFQKWRSKSL